jgi:hypothetical protein
MTLLNQITDVCSADKANLLAIFNTSIETSNEQCLFLLLHKIKCIYRPFSLGFDEFVKCISCEKINIVRHCLLLNVFDLHSETFDRAQIVAIIIEKNLFSLLELLIDHYDLDIKHILIEGEPCIFHAIQSNNSQLSGFLLLNGFDIHAKNKQGRTLLEICVAKNWLLHTSHIIRHHGLPQDRLLFHRLCRIALKNNSTLIFNMLLTSYYAVVIQRKWRIRKHIKQNTNL